MKNKIEKIVKENPNKIAYKVNDKFITYKELWDSSCYYAELLKKQGTSPVIIYGHKDIDVIISILSCILADRTYVPVELSTPINRLKQIIKISNSSLIISNNKLIIDNIDCISLDELNKFKDNEINENKNDIVYIIFTSGSTGIPKGVPISKENLNNFVNWISDLKPLCDYRDINVFNQASFSFDLSVADIFYSLCNGHTLIALNNDINENFDEVFKTFTEIDVAVMTPTFMKICLLNKQFNSNNYPKLKCVYFCGEQLDVKIVRNLYNAFPKLVVINAYGPTEATSAVSAITITKEMADNMELLPVGEIDNFATKIDIIDGEIVLSGKSVFSGYLDNFVGGYYKNDNINCYKTGDIGYIEDGKLYCKGRMDSQIKYKGYRIELSDIENNINLINGIKGCAVVAKCDDNLVVKTIKAFVEVEKNVDINYIKTELKKHIPIYMIPKTIKIIERLPINKNGKIDRKALSEL